MMISMLDAHKAGPSACPRCGHPIASIHRCAWIETTLGVLAIIALLLLLAALGILVWKAWVSDRESHSILCRPLEDWTQY